MPWTVMPAYDTHAQARAEFAWALPETFNPATDLLAKHPPDGTALRAGQPGDRTTLSFGRLDDEATRLAGALADRGLEAGDRIGVMAPQRPETLLAHCAAWTLGAITVPLTTLFGPDALRHRLADSGARAIVVDSSVAETVNAVRGDCPALDLVVPLDDEDGYDSLVAAGPERFEPHEATPATRSAIMYTSGSTGPPKGVLHTHALWLGRAAAAACFFAGELGPDAVCWTPADWAWGGSLGGLVYAALHHGATVVTDPPGPFEPADAWTLLATEGITHAFVPPTALRMLMDVDPPAADELSLSVIAAAGEPLTPELRTWAGTTLPDVSLNEFYGQTELNLVVASCDHWFEQQPGSMGRPLPGYDVEIRDEAGDQCETDELGEIAVRPADERVVFDGYWGLPERTAEKRDGEWYLTGDLATRDADGDLWFHARADDLIITSGYRVGPGEVEAVILEHPAVEQVGVVGVPDETRGEIVKAFVQPVGDLDRSRLRTEIETLVRDQLAAYEYPREIEFVDALPRTTTGKIRRSALRPDEG